MDPEPPVPMDPPPSATIIPLSPAPISTTPTTATTTETPPSIHIAHVANPAPTHSPTPRHPPYAEMITAAIAALKEREGSSKTAIAKYIDREFSNLPATHAALLTLHLKRLKNSGQIVMVKHSYKLPTTPRSAPPPPENAAPTGLSPLSSQYKKRPGRPPKLNPDSVSPVQAQNQFIDPAQNFDPAVGSGQIQYQAQNVADGPSSSRRKPGRPAKNKDNLPPVAQSNGGVVGSEAMFISLGLSDGPSPVSGSKRRPGRPRKADWADPNQPNSVNQSGSKRKLGRPPKNGPLVGPTSSGKPRGRPKKDGPISGSESKKRGRKPKTVGQYTIGQVPGGVSVPYASVMEPQSEYTDAAVAAGALPAVMVPYLENPPYLPSSSAVAGGAQPQVAVPISSVPVNGVAPPSSGKRRGRPPKTDGTPKRYRKSNSNPIYQSGSKRRPGRPPKNLHFPGGDSVPHASVMVPLPDPSGGSVPQVAAPVSSVAVNGVGPPSAGKRRGRPPKVDGAPKKFRKLSGKLVGRPRKNVRAHDTSQNFAFINLKSKLEYLQTRVKETVSLLKPMVNNETSPGALEALQQLEELANVDVNPSESIQAQPPVQQV